MTGREAGLDLPKFNQCLSGGSHATAIRKGAEEAFSAGLQGTPAFVIGIPNEKDPSDPNIKVVSIISGAALFGVQRSDQQFARRTESINIPVSPSTNKDFLESRV